MQTALPTDVPRTSARLSAESAISVAISATSAAQRARIVALVQRAGAHIVSSGETADILLIARDSSSPMPTSVTALSLLLPHVGNACVIWIDGSPDPSTLSRLLRAGVAGIVPIDIPGSKFQQALRAIRSGLQVVDSAFARSAGEVFPKRGTGKEKLTEREQQVLTMMAEGLANKEISSRLAISTHTVKFHISSILGSWEPRLEQRR